MFKLLKKYNLLGAINNLRDDLNTNKILAGFIMIAMNIGTRYIDLKLTKGQELLLKNIAREVLIFTIAFINTKDIVTSIIITLIFIIMANFLLNEESDYNSNNNYSANVIDEHISKSLTNSLNSELEKIQKMRQSGNNIPHNVFFNNNELHNNEVNNEDNNNKGTGKSALSTNNLYDSSLLGNITKNSNVSNYNDSYNLKYNASSQNPNTINYDNNKLISKLEYIIHLLEEQHNEKTNYITEELILYLFLGIFILFVLDSFARASKYVR